MIKRNTAAMILGVTGFFLMLLALLFVIAYGIVDLFHEGHWVTGTAGALVTTGALGIFMGYLIDGDKP